MLLAAALVLAQEAEPWRTHVVELEDPGARLALRDLDGDGRLDLVRVDAAGLQASLQGPDGAFVPALDADGDGAYAWPGAELLWCFADLVEGGGDELVVLTSDGVVRAHRVDARGFDAGRVVLESACYLPRGRGHAGFVRDLDGDGRADLVLPGSGRYRLHRQLADGGFAAAIEVVFEPRVVHAVGDPDVLDGRFAQTVSVPWFRLEDVDGDSRLDLVSRTSERVAFHLASPELAPEPTWSLDLAALAAEAPRADGVDLDDLLANVDLGVQYELADLDGVAPRDLVVQVGSTVKVHLGGSVHGTSRAPDQVLRVSGNLLFSLVRDTDGDGRADLQLVRGDRVSLGRVLRWLVLPGALDFELFTYRNEGGAFSRTPTRRQKVRLEIPRLLTLVERVEAMEEELERQAALPARRFDLTGSGRRDGIVDLEAGALLVFASGAPSEDEDLLRGLREGDLERAFDDLVLDDLDALGDGGTKVIDVGDLETWTYSPGAALRAARQGREPTHRVPLAFGGADGTGVEVVDLDGDGADDAVVWLEREGRGALVQLVVLRD